MCGRFVIFSGVENEEIKKIVDEINAHYYPYMVKTGEVFPTDTVPIIALRDGKKVMGPARFGFPGYKEQRVMINARSETLKVKPTFRNLLQNNRCVVPVSGYYEWMQAEGKKVKYLIRTDTPVAYLAGLYNRFSGRNNNPYIGFVIITTTPSSPIAHIHDRMPVILAPEAINEWLAGGDYEHLLTPYGNLSVNPAE